MGREERLTKPRQYALVYEKGRSLAGNLVVVRAVPNGLEISRCGLTVSKRVGKAVARNRVKRLLREIIRTMPLRRAWDIVLIARPAAASADYHDLRRAVEGLLARGGLLDSGQKPGPG